MEILGHRGLDPSIKGFYSESSFEAFQDHLNRGFGIEFDVNITKDGIVIAHDSTLERITSGDDKREFRDLSSKEILKIKLKKGRMCPFDDLMELIRQSHSKMNALHIKGKFQNKKNLDLILKNIMRYGDLLKRIIIFDIKPDSARYLKSKNKDLILAPSVAHEFDIKRYNSAVMGTLISISDAIKYKKLYDWVWLDEWDRRSGVGNKKFYTAKNFKLLRSAGYNIALVTPELHGTSPGLLGGEAHNDALSKNSLFKRIDEIIGLNPDALCTDYPEEVRNLYFKKG